MSHDELQPESETLPAVTEATDSALETSLPDAPPAAPRRRRARAAEADAASVPDTIPAEKPKPRRRSAAKPAEPPPEIVADAAPVVETPEPVAPEKPTRRRSPRVKTPPAETPVEAVAAPDSTVAPTPAAEPEPAAPIAETPEPAAPEKPTRRRSPRRAKSAEPVSLAPETDPDTAVAITPRPEIVPAPVTEAAEADAETAVPEATADSPAVAVAPKTEPDAALSGAETGSEATDADTDKTRRRRRPRRGREEIAEKPAIAAIADDAPPAPEAALETPTTDETATGRTRSRRRNGRARRDRPETTPTEPLTFPRPPAALIVLPTAQPVTEIRPEVRIEREPPIDTSVGAHLLSPNGVPEIFINSVPYAPIFFFGNVDDPGARQKVVAEARRAAANGVHLHSTLIELPCPLTESSDAIDKFDARVRALLDADPDGFVMPRLVFIPAKGWKREYPNDIASYADGTSSDPSLTSERFWAEAERSLVTLIGHVREHEWGKRIFGYHLERGEWFQPQDTGYDRSVANRDAFRDWLREKYRHDLVGLRAAWYDGDIQFHTAEIPSLMTKPNPQRAFFETRRERQYIDFNEFTSESTAKRLVALAKSAKKAANHQALISVCYGYTFEFGHGYSGHLSLDLLLESPHIDLLCGPPSYRDRQPGGAASLPAPVESALLHGKLWLSEDDTKTYLAPPDQDPEDFNPRLGDKFATEQAQIRAMGRALTQNVGIGWMDLWGEGWLDDDGMWERIGEFSARCGAALRQQDGLRVPEVIALVDEKSLLHIQRGEAFFRKITNGLRDTLQRVGVSYGTYLQSDILHENFPLTAKLYLFLTPYRLTTAQRTAIQEKLQQGGRTLAFLYAPGSCEARPTLSGAMEEVAGGSVGLILRQQEWNSEIGSRVIEPHHPLTERLTGREIGTRERINPSFYVDDPDATVLAEYQGSGLPSVAARDFGKWKSVFIGEPTLPLEMLRGLCRYAGVNVWTTGDDVFSAGNGWVLLHSTRDGNRVLRLPTSAPLYDLTESRFVSEGTRDYRFFVKSGATRLFYVGGVEAMRDLNLPNLPAPGAERTGETFAKFEPEAFFKPFPQAREPRERIAAPETETVAPAEIREPKPSTLSADLATLEAVLSLDVSELDLEAEPQEQGVEPPLARPLAPDGILPLAIFGETEAELNRRRRRRGGRGRGRRRIGSISEAKEENGAAPPDNGAETPRIEAGAEIETEAWNHAGEDADDGDD